MIFAAERLSLARDGAQWPNRALSREVRAGGLTWHVQQGGPRRGDGPTLLLLHGVGAATHSFADAIPPLAERFRVIAADAPGHGFTSAPPGYRLSLRGQGAAFAALLDALGAAPDLVVGHSAGAAIALRMTLDGQIAPKAVLAVNGALRPFPGLAGLLFPAMARALFLNPFSPRLLALSAVDRRRVATVLASTGSRVSEAMLDRYATLLRNPGHVSSALGMMAHWRLERLVADLPRLQARLVLLVGAGDRALPPREAQEAARAAPNASMTTWPDCGHLAHEEHPERFVALVEALADELTLGPEASCVGAATQQGA